MSEKIQCPYCNGEGAKERTVPATETSLEYEAEFECAECNGEGMINSDHVSVYDYLEDIEN